METQSKKLKDNKLEITVSLTAEEVQKEVDAAYKQAGKSRIPGFRPGKAPRKILDNHFGGKEYFLAQATDELIQAFTPLSHDELNLIPLSNPDFAELDVVAEGEPFVFTYSIEVTPELELSSYEPVKIELPSAEPTEEEMQVQIETLLAYYMTSDEEGNDVKPELTDAWVKETLEFENVDEFKVRLGDSLREQKGQDLPMLREVRSSQELASRLLGEVPDTLTRQTEQENYRDLFQSLQQQRMTLDAYLEAYGFTSETFRDSMREQAENSAAMALALDAMARHLELSISEEEIMGEFLNSGVKDSKALYADWQKNGRLSEIRQGLARMKASQHVIDTAEVFEPGTLAPVKQTDEKPAKKTKKASASKEDEAKAEKAPASKAKAKKKAGTKEEDSSEVKPAKKTKKVDDAKAADEVTKVKDAIKADDAKE